MARFLNMGFGMRFPKLIFAAFLVVASAGAEAQTARDIHLKRGYSLEETLYLDCVSGFGLRTPQRDACAKLLDLEELQNPRTSSDHARRSAIFAALTEYGRAVDEADAAIALDAKNATAYSVRGAANWNLGETAAAAADFERALELNPVDTDALFGRGAIHFRNAEFTQALRLLDQAIAIKPEFVAAYVYRGETRTWLERHDGAIADFDSAIRLDPEDWRARLSRGNVLATLARYSEALADYDEAIRAAPDNGAPLNSKAWLLATASDPMIRNGAAAVAAAERALAIDDSDPDFHDTAAAAYAETGDFARAVASEERAIALWRAERDIGAARDAEGRLALYENGSPYREIR